MGLKVEHNIPFANMCAVEVNERTDLPTVAFAANPTGGPEGLWFSFRISRTGRGRTGGSFRLILKHVSNLLGVGKPSALRPVIRCEDQLWERMPPGEVHETPDGQVQLHWTLSQPDGHLDLALCYPYGPAEVRRLVEECPGLMFSEIGVSQQGRPILRVSNGIGRLRDERPGLYLIARQHAGETPGSWVLDGLIRRLAALGDKAPLFWSVPLMDMDGIEAGAYGKDRFPYDLNRAWGNPPMRHEITVVQNDIHRWMQRSKPMLFLDFHAPGGSETEGIYCFLNPPEEYRSDYQAAMVWAGHFGRVLAPEYAAPVFARTAQYRSRWETPNSTRYAQDTLGVSAISFEIPYALCGNAVMTCETYRETGARLADAMVGNIGYLVRPTSED